MRKLINCLLVVIILLSSLACSGRQDQDKYIGHSVGDDRIVATLIYWPEDMSYREVMERWDQGRGEMPAGPPAWLEVRYRDLEPLLEHKRIALRHGVDVRGGKEYLLTHRIMIDIIQNDLRLAFVQYVENYGQVEQMKERLAMAVEELEKGTPFQTVAEEYSDDLGTKDVGGRLADVGPENSYYPISLTAFDMEDDEWRAYKDTETLEPIASIYGFHIIKRYQYFPAQGIYPPHVGIAHILLKYNNITETQNFSNIYKDVRKRVLFFGGRTHTPALVVFQEPSLLAQDALSRQDWRAGIKYLKGAKETDPDNLLVDAKLAEVYVQLGFIDQAIDVLNEAVEKIEQDEIRTEYKVLVPGFYLRLAKYYLADNREAEFIKTLGLCYESYSSAVLEDDFHDSDLWEDIKGLYTRMGMPIPEDPVSLIKSPEDEMLGALPLRLEDDPAAQRRERDRTGEGESQ